MSRILALLRFEYVKLRGRRITWVPLVVLFLLAVLIVAVFHYLQFSHARTIFNSFQLKFTSKADFVNGYYMAAHSMKPAFEMLIPIFICVAAGLSVAGENELGTLRACLVRPVPRRDLVLVKFALLTGYTLVLCVFFLSVVACLGLLCFGGGDLYTLDIVFHNGENSFSCVPQAELPMRFLLAAVLATLGSAVLVALSLLVSCLVESAAMAYVVTLSIFFTELTLRALPFLDWLYPYLFTTHMLRWEQCFASHIKTGQIAVSLVHLAAYLIVFLAAAVLLFQEKDIKA